MDVIIVILVAFALGIAAIMLFRSFKTDGNKRNRASSEGGGVEAGSDGGSLSWFGFGGDGPGRTHDGHDGGSHDGSGGDGGGGDGGGD